MCTGSYGGGSVAASTQTCASFFNVAACQTAGCTWTSKFRNSRRSCWEDENLVLKRTWTSGGKSGPTNIYVEDFPADAYTRLSAVLPPHPTVAPFDLSWKDMLHKKVGKKWGYLKPFRRLPTAFRLSASEHRIKAFMFGTVESRLWSNHHTVQCEIPLTTPRFDTLINPEDYHVRALDVVTMEARYYNMGNCSISAAQFKRSTLGTAAVAEHDDPVSCYTIVPQSTTIAVPYPTAFGAGSAEAMAAHTAKMASAERTVLMAYAGGNHGMQSALRSKILAWCKDSTECHAHNCNRKDDCVDNRAILDTYSRSIFCLQPAGDTPTRQGWFDALLSGCIPVFFSSCLRPDLYYERAYAPFLPAFERTAYGAGDWAVVLDSSATMTSAASTLRGIDAQEVHRMQRRIAEISPGIQYSRTPGVVRDAQTIYTEVLDARYSGTQPGARERPAAESVSARPAQHQYTPGALIYEYPALAGQTPEDLMGCFLSRFPTPLVDNSFFKEPGAYVPEDMAEWFLHRQLAESKLKTADPEKAGLYIVNAMPVLSSVTGWCNGVSHTERQHYWAHTLLISPWMQRRSGTDHAFICQSWTCMPLPSWAVGHKGGSWYGTNVVASAVTEALRLIVAEMTLWIHEDFPEWTGRLRGDRVVVVPYVVHSGMHSTAGGHNRTTHCLFMGSVDRKFDSNHALLAQWRSPMRALRGVTVIDSGVDHSEAQEFESYAARMRSATFCLVVAGDTLSSRRLFDAVVAGCIPVLVSPPNTLPFESTVRWDDFVVRLDTNRWLNGGAQLEVDRLNAVSKPRIAAMRAAMATAAPLLDWRSGDGVLQTLLKEKVPDRAPSQAAPGFTTLPAQKLFVTTNTTGLEGYAPVKELVAHGDTSSWVRGFAVKLIRPTWYLGPIKGYKYSLCHTAELGYCLDVTNPKVGLGRRRANAQLALQKREGIRMLAALKRNRTKVQG